MLGHDFEKSSKTLEKKAFFAVRQGLAEFAQTCNK